MRSEKCAPHHENEDESYHCECQPVRYSHKFETTHDSVRGPRLLVIEDDSSDTNLALLFPRDHDGA